MTEGGSTDGCTVSVSNLGGVSRQHVELVHSQTQFA